MAHDRNMITPGDIARLCTWLTANGIDWRGPKGDFQLLQIKVKDGYGAICTNSKGVVSTPPSIREMLRDFSMGKPYTAASTKSAVLGGKSAAIANDEFITDLRDDFAMAALRGLLGGMWHGHKDTPHIETSKIAYDFADAMLEARKVRAAPTPERAPRKSDDWSPEWKANGFNGCMSQASKALQYLASYDRPSYGESPFNAEHLLQIAGELELTKTELLRP